MLVYFYVLDIHPLYIYYHKVVHMTLVNRYNYLDGYAPTYSISGFGQSSKCCGLGYDKFYSSRWYGDYGYGFGYGRYYGNYGDYYGYGYNGYGRNYYDDYDVNYYGRGYYGDYGRNYYGYGNYYGSKKGCGCGCSSKY